jgi:AcrR family transcriptional regulator
LTEARSPVKHRLPLPRKRSHAELDPRRDPVQARATDRRDALLDAAAELLVERGFAAVNTRAIAAAAGAAIGTVYDYFPNKHAVFLALLDRYRERLAAAIDASAARASTWEEAVHEGIEVFYRFYRDEPGYRELWLGSQLVDELREHGERWGAEFSKRLEAMVLGFFPHADATAVSVVSRLFVHIVSAAATTALTGPKRLARPTIDETKALIVLWLRDRIAR